MPATPRNIVADGPEFFKNLAYGAVPFDAYLLDASPIYLNMEGIVSGRDGSYTEGLVTYVVTYHQYLKPILSRVTLRGDATNIVPAHEEILRDHDVSSWLDRTDQFAGGSGTFFALQVGVDYAPGSGIVQLSPYSPPLFINFDFFQGFVGVITRTDNSTSPPTVTTQDILYHLTGPKFTGSIFGGDLKMTITFTVNMNYSGPGAYTNIFTIEIDCSAWGSPDFRDIRGDYIGNFTDPNGLLFDCKVGIA